MSAAKKPKTAPSKRLPRMVWAVVDRAEQDPATGGLLSSLFAARDEAVQTAKYMLANGYATTNELSVIGLRVDLSTEIKVRGVRL